MLLDNAWKKVKNGATVEFACLMKLNSKSPIVVEAKDWDKDKKQVMTIEIK